MWVLPFSLPYLILLVTIWAHSEKRDYIQWIPLALVWVIIPILDFAVGDLKNERKLHVTERKTIENSLIFRFIVIIWAPIQLLFLFWSCRRATDSELSWIRFLTMSAGTGIISAGGINVAHELFHKLNRIEILLGELLLVSVCYGHFIIEHKYGHHKNVATPIDPATFRYNESFYHFLPRTIIGGFKSAWRIECIRLRMQNRKVWQFDNSIIRYYVASIAIAVVLTVFNGIRALAFFLLQSLFAIFLLEQVNAIEHYGLMRKEVKKGEFEPVAAQHSWDVPHRLSNYLLFKLQYHSDHHLRKSYCDFLY